LLRRGHLHHDRRRHRARGVEAAGGPRVSGAPEPQARGSSPRRQRNGRVSDRKVAIVTDSTSDLPAQMAKSRSISVVPLTLTFEGLSLLDGVDIRPSEFYRRLPTATTHPTTSQPSPARFAETYTSLLESHSDIVSIHISEQ